jgi:threonine dehydratase
MTRSQIEAAAERISGHIRTTPVIDAGTGVTLKLELLQHTGSFKPRGAFSKTLASKIPESGIIAASGGNHGAAVAYVARSLDCRAEVFVPEISSHVKIDRLRRYGACVTVTGATYAEALEASMRRAEQTGAFVVHAYDQPEVIAGQGTVGMEFEEQAAALDTVLVAVGGGGLIAGIAAWFSGRVKVVGVEPRTTRCLHAAFEAGRPVDVPVSGIAADSLGAKRVGGLAWSIAQRYVSSVVLVDDEEIRRAQQQLWEQFRIAAEPGGAAAYAAVISKAYPIASGERVGVLVCGGNVAALPE